MYLVVSEAAAGLIRLIHIDWSIICKGRTKTIVQSIMQ